MITDKINGRTPEEIKKGLEMCCEGTCRECTYQEECDEHIACGGDMVPVDKLFSDSLSLIQQLERERDAAARDMMLGRICATCRYYGNKATSKCYGCHSWHSNWQWRGVEVG